MIEETVLVVKTDDEFAWVDAQRQSACGQCSAQKGCGTGVLAGVFGKKMSNIKVINSAHAKAGDLVVIGLRESSLLKSAMISYLLPLILILAGALVVRMFFNIQNEIGIIFGALCGFIVSIFYLRNHAERIKSNPAYQPVVLRKAGLNLPHEITD